MMAMIGNLSFLSPPYPFFLIFLVSFPCFFFSFSFGQAWWCLARSFARPAALTPSPISWTALLTTLSCNTRASHPTALASSRCPRHRPTTRAPVRTRPRRSRYSNKRLGHKGGEANSLHLFECFYVISCFFPLCRFGDVSCRLGAPSRGASPSRATSPPAPRAWTPTSTSDEMTRKLMIIRRRR